jgi:glycine hydroxymethyltransferase
MAEIAKEVSAYLFADMAHLAGLIAAKAIPSPVPHCDFITFTCYKTMMGGRGGVILCKQDYAKKIDSAIFPGCQGTSAVNLIAAKALIFKLAIEPEFVAIQKKTLENADCLAKELDKKGYRIVTGGTDNHQVLVDVTSKGLEGNTAEKLLESVGIITNRNVISSDSDSPGKISGIRLGSSAVTSRGMEKPDIVKIADLIDAAMVNHDNKDVLDRVSEEVLELCKRFPVYN